MDPHIISGQCKTQASVEEKRGDKETCKIRAGRGRVCREIRGPGAVESEVEAFCHCIEKELIYKLLLQLFPQLIQGRRFKLCETNSAVTVVSLFLQKTQPFDTPRSTGAYGTYQIGHMRADTLALQSSSL